MHGGTDKGLFICQDLEVAILAKKTPKGWPLPGCFPTLNLCHYKSQQVDADQIGHCTCFEGWPLKLRVSRRTMSFCADKAINKWLQRNNVEKTNANPPAALRLVRTLCHLASQVQRVSTNKAPISEKAPRVL